MDKTICLSCDKFDGITQGTREMKEGLVEGTELRKRCHQTSSLTWKDLEVANLLHLDERI